MSEPGTLESLQALHTELLPACEHRLENVAFIQESLLAHADVFRKLLEKPARDAKSRAALQSGKITVGEEEYSVNREFVETALQLADELELDEIAAAKLVLDSQGDRDVLGRSLFECGIIRFHQQRKYLLDCVRLCLVLAGDDELDEHDPNVQDFFGVFVAENIYGAAVPGGPAPDPARKMVPRCLAAMHDVKVWLHRITDKVATTSLVYQGPPAIPPELREAIEYSRVSLVQQHELLAVILCRAVEGHQATAQHFGDFVQLLRRIDRYDHLLAHLFPAIGAFISMFGSTEGSGDLRQARQLHRLVCKPADDDARWTLPYLGATVRAWWIAEYSGWYLDDPVGSPVQGVDLDEEDSERARQFLEALKEGAFDFMLAVAADTRSCEWQDSSRTGVRQWLQRKSPPLASDPVAFSDFFQRCLALRLEVFIDAFISNLPDVLRRLRTEEDEQRQLSQSHEQDLDLERFLVLIAHAYDGRPDAADAFWSDPDSNLAGFLHWASRRASTPLVSAFCEMLQALSDGDECATAAHEFLLDEGHHSSGKMRRAQSLTWGQIFKELMFFTAKIRDRPSNPPAPAAAAAHSAHLRATATGKSVSGSGSGSSELAETEPESAVMLECYLRLISKLAANSRSARTMLLRDPAFNLVEVLFQLASSTIPARLRASLFHTLDALLSHKAPEEGYIMWRCVDSWMVGGYALRGNANTDGFGPAARMDAIFDEIADGFEEPNAFIQFLTSLVSPVEDHAPLHDTLPFPEDIGSAARAPGIDPYVDYVLGHVLATKARDLQDASQLRLLRLRCLDFALACLDSFNEELIVLGNEAAATLAIDAAVSATDLATYVRLHPAARVMEWMLDDNVLRTLLAAVHQDPAETGRAAPDSPLLLGILRAVQLVTRVLDLQATYLDLVRPLVRLQQQQAPTRPPRRHAVADATHASFEDGLMNHLDLVVDLGRLCAVGYPPLTLACLKLLEKISSSSRIVAAWNPEAGRPGHRNKAVVALEAAGEAEPTAASLSAELTATLDFVRGPDAPNYPVKIFVLDFLYECLRASPDQPTIAHLLLGFRCGVSSLAVDADGPFFRQDSLFHSLLKLLFETPHGEGADADCSDPNGIRAWLVALKSRVLRVLQRLWTSPLSSLLVTDELRTLQFPLHLLVREVSIQPHLRWERLELGAPGFLLADSALAYLDFLSMRAMVFEYLGMELCNLAQSRMPGPKRQLLDALLGGQIRGDDNEPINVPNAFDLYDFMPADSPDDVPVPEFHYYKELDLRPCVRSAAGNGRAVLYDMARVREVLLLKQNEARNTGAVATPNELAAMEREEALLLEYLTYTNRQRSVAALRADVLAAWTRLVLIMVETNDFRGADRTSFLQQALQALLPSLDAFSADGRPEAFELAKLANVLLFRIDHLQDGEKGAVVIADKLFHLFQICLAAIGRWAGHADLRSVYYSICYRYLVGVAGRSDGNHSRHRHKAAKAVQAYGDRLINVVCDDAYGSDLGCQTAATILLGALAGLGRAEGDLGVVETLNRLNFVGVLVDSLKTLLQDWLEIMRTDNIAAEHYVDAKLSLLLQLCQTRAGAKHVLNANLFRALELSGLFAADPELEMDPAAPGDVATTTAALARHYGLLVRTARVVAAAVVAGRAGHAVVQGRRFLAQYRLLVAHTLKRSAGIGSVGGSGGTKSHRSGVAGGTRGQAENEKGPAAGEAQARLEEHVEDLAQAFMVIITAAGFLEFEEEQMPAEKPREAPVLFH